MGLFSGIKKIVSKGVDALTGGSLFDGLGSSLIAGGLSFLGGERANKATERLSNTSYTRAVQDMENAGLNPMLAYSQGGASTPSMTDTLTPAVSSAQHGRRLSEDVKNLRASRALLEEQARASKRAREARRFLTSSERRRPC